MAPLATSPAVPDPPAPEEPRLDGAADLLARPGTFVALGWVAFQLYAALVASLPTFLVAATHLGFALALGLVGTRSVRELANPRGLVEALGAVAALASAAYVIAGQQRFSERIAFVDRVDPADVAVGLVVIALTFVVSWRVLGPPLAVVALVFVGYGFAGRALPGPLAHRGMSLETFVEVEFLSSFGIYGVPLGVSAEIVFYFVLFGILLERSGGGRLFVDIAFATAGRLRGGAAKASIVSSALFGTVSGSAVANVVVDGIFSVPLMKRTGFRPHFAAAVEAAASTGGQLMPPVMGAGAFILAQFIGRPYAEVALAAAIPAVLYYISLFFVIDLEARRLGIAGTPRSELPDVRRGLRERGHLLVSLVVLVALIATGTSLALAALAGSAVALAAAFARRETRLGAGRLLEGLVAGAREAITVAAPTAVAGLIIGVIVSTGLGLKFTGVLSALAVGQLWLALALVMLAALVLGMGMPTSAAYLMAAVLLGPALQSLGVEPLAAHLFIFYSAVISMITPPVALAAYAAAGIARASVWLTGWTAFRLTLAGFVIPYAFVIDRSLLLEGPLAVTVLSATTAGLGMVAGAAAIVGYLRAALGLWERAAALAAALLLVLPHPAADAAGLALLAALVVLRRPGRRAPAFARP